MDSQERALRLGLEAARAIARGENWAEPWLTGLAATVGFDAGLGLAMVGTPEKAGSDDVAAPDVSSVRIVMHGAPDMSPKQAAAAFAAAPHDVEQDPTLVATRMSDLIQLPGVWDTEAYDAIHGIYDAHYPAALGLGKHAGCQYFVGMHRRRRDFSDQDLATLDAAQPLVVAALAFHTRLDETAVRLDRPLRDDRATLRALSPRQRDVLALVASGWTNRQIGHRLGITERTVRKHVGDIFERLDVHSRTAAALWHKQELSRLL